MATPFIGDIRMFGGNFAPPNYLFCWGQILAISEYESLFNLIGTIYGGDGQSTFALPDLRGRVPVHMGANGVVLGTSAGSETTTLNVTQIPAHSHLVGVAPNAKTTDPTGNLLATTAAGSEMFLVPPGTAATAAAASISAGGGSQPHSNMMPCLGINFIIAVFGVFPSQN